MEADRTGWIILSSISFFIRNDCCQVTEQALHRVLPFCRSGIQFLLSEREVRIVRNVSIKNPF